MPNAVLTCKVQLARSVETHQVSRKSTASSKARRLQRIHIERLKAEMEAKLQFEKREMEAQKREMEAQKREMEMRIKLADLAAREALLEMEETESILEKK